MSARTRTGSVLFFTVAILLVSIPAFASYGWTKAPGIADNSAWYGTNQCLISIGDAMAETKAAADGTIYGLTAGHVLYTYTRGTGWVEAASALQTAGGYPLTHVSVGSSSNVLALSTAPTNNV
jgi:hypothetical protein